MPETEEKEQIIRNLKYIGLDLENIPSFLREYKDVDYKPTKAYEQTDFRVYKYINIKDIQILLTPTNRLNSISEKYSKAIPLCEFLDDKDETKLVNYAKFLKMIESLNIKEIKKIEEEQEKMAEKIPFGVKFDTNYLWEIFYSEYTGEYFMMVTTEDQDYNAFFYLLKKQIECYNNNKDEYIFAPISYMDYTKRYLKKSEISDIEKYIWIFTKDWANVYEVFDRENEMSLHIVGYADVYNKIKSIYKIELKTKEDAVKLYTLLKALFILKTELPHHYDFETQINEKGELIFEFNNKIINYDNLSKFVKDEYLVNASKLKEIFAEKEKTDIELANLKEEEIEKGKEYLFREKQVTTYLECRKSMFGKIKYFFKNKNGKFVKNKTKNTKAKKIKEENEIQKDIVSSIIVEKELYTIEDLIKICIELDRVSVRIKDAKLDIKGLKDKIKVLDGKINNATIFIQSIEDHKKSIFEFWKFSNKDVALGLNEGTKEEKKESPRKIKRVFDYEEDLEDLGVEADKLERGILTHEDTNSLYLATTDVLEDINVIHKNENTSKLNLEKVKAQFNNQDNENDNPDFDIFGNIKNDMTKISVLSNQRHRESEKDKYKILDITDDMSEEEYKVQIENHTNIIEKAIEKIKAITDIDVYVATDEKIGLEDINLCYINPNDALSAKKELNKLNLCKIRIKEGMNIIYNTNIIYYNNANGTLPIGMNVGSTVLFNMSKYKIDLKKQKIFRIMENKENLQYNDKIICAYEYEVSNKEQ